MSMWAAFGIAGGVLSCVDALPYVRDILRGSTRPHRGTWGIWSLLGLIAFAAQVASGAGWSLLMVGIQAASVTTVFCLSLSRGVGGLAWWDRTLMIVAALGMVGWLASSRPIVATVCVVAADSIGVMLMMPKTWRDPYSETPSSYLLAAASGAFGAAAAGSLDVGLVLYPAYFGVANAVTAAVILLRRRDSPVEAPSLSGEAAVASRR
jgi:hypothetical protein